MADDPRFKSETFPCPFEMCGVHSKQRWCFPGRQYQGDGGYGGIDRYGMCRCDTCGKESIWVAGALVYPRSLTTVPPNPDLPADALPDFEEARKICSDSPRGAAALLRLCIQKLCIDLGQPGKNINEDIGALVEAGLPAMVQQSLDIVRVVGNNAVHPGTIDLDDTPEIADQLFSLVNLVVEVMITQPNHVTAMYEAVVPEGARAAIERRDEE